MRKIILLSISFLLAMNLSAQYATEKKVCKSNICAHSHNYDKYTKQNTMDINPEWYTDYDIHFYFLDIEADDDNINLSGKVTIHAKVKKDNLTIFHFQLHNALNISEVKVNNESVNFERNGYVVSAEISPLNTNDEIVAEISYQGTPPTGGFFSGISNGFASGFNVTWTLSEPYAALEWFPCKQDLSDKADSVYVFVTVEDPAVVASNGILTAKTPLENNKTRYEWKSNYPIAYYLISMAIANYQEYNIYAHPEQLDGDSVLIQNYIYNSNSALYAYQEDIDKTPSMVELFSNLYGLYPFHEEKYGHAISPMGGGMEHQTMSTMGGFSFYLIAHELGHMWFGDNVTCKNWQDIWVNEGFASYSEYLAFEYLNSQVTADSWMSDAHSNIMSSPNGSVYVPEEELDDIWRIFSARLTYDKGAAILHMLRFEVQDDGLFFEILKTYQEQFRDSVATGDDFKNVAEEVTGKDFDAFFKQWYYGEGYPTYNVEYSNDNGYFFMKTTQSPSTDVTPFFDMLMEYELEFEDGTTERILVQQTDNVTEYTKECEKTVTNVIVDPDNWVLNRVGSIVINVEQNLSDEYFAFWPNPAKNTLNLEFNNQPSAAKLKISTVTGQVVKTIIPNAKNMNLNIDDLKSGMYIITYESNNQKMNRKLIIE